MPRDLAEELTLLDLSRIQRAALERWLPILLTAGEVEIAEEVRQQLTEPDMELAA
jgi:hypothetical protein